MTFRTTRRPVATSVRAGLSGACKPDAKKTDAKKTDAKKTDAKKTDAKKTDPIKLDAPPEATKIAECLKTPRLDRKVCGDARRVALEGGAGSRWPDGRPISAPPPSGPRPKRGLEDEVKMPEPGELSRLAEEAHKRERSDEPLTLEGEAGVGPRSDGADVGVGTGPSLVNPREAADAVGDAIDWVKKKVSDNADTIVEKGKTVAKEIARRTLPGIETAEDFEEMSKGMPDAKEIGKLQTGDKITVGMNVGGAAGPRAQGGVDLGTKGTIEKNPDGTYKVSIEGEGNIALLGNLKKLKGKLSLGAGGKIEYNARTPEEAQKIMEAAALVAAEGHPAQAVVRAPKIRTPEEQRAHEAKLKEARALLNQRTSGVEVTGQAALALSAALGVKSGDTKIGLGSLSGNVKRAEKVRINMEPGKNPGDESKAKSIEWSTERSGELKGSVGLSLGIEKTLPSGKTESGGGASLAGKELSGKVTLTRTTKMDLPDGVTVDNLLNDPTSTLAGAREQMKRSRQDTTELTVEGKAGRDSVKLTVKVDENKVDPRALVENIKNGEWEAAGRSTGVEEAKLELFEKRGLDLQVGVDVVVAEAELGVERSTTRRRKVLRLTPVPETVEGAAGGSLAAAA